MISILMPVYNAAETLPHAVASIRRQSLADWELVAVDDGSTDDSPRLLAAASAADPRIRLIRRPHAGLVASLNAGLAACRGESIARFDADDLMHRDRLALQAAEQFDGVLGCGVIAFPWAGLSEPYRRYLEWLNGLLSHEAIVRDLFVESPLAHPSVLLPRHWLERVGGYRDIGFPEDYDLWLRLWRAGARFGKLPQRLHFWRDHEARLTRTHAMYRRKAFRECKLSHLLGTVLASHREVVLWGSGKAARQWSRMVTGAALTVRCHVAWGDDPPAEVRGAPVVPAAALPLGGPPVLVTVGFDPEREAIRDWLRHSGRGEGREFVCVA